MRNVNVLWCQLQIKETNISTLVFLIKLGQHVQHIKHVKKDYRVNLSTFAYRLFHEDVFSILGAKCSGISNISVLYIQHFGRDSMYAALVISYLILVETLVVLGGKSLLESLDQYILNLAWVIELIV